jgi:primary-amine oxidase
MPVEHLNITFKPVSFFASNPSMDVPGVRDPHSVPAFAEASPDAAQTCH